MRSDKKNGNIRQENLLYASVSIDLKDSPLRDCLFGVPWTFRSFVEIRSFCLRVFAFTFGAALGRSLPESSSEYSVYTDNYKYNNITSQEILFTERTRAAEGCHLDRVFSSSESELLAGPTVPNREIMVLTNLQRELCDSRSLHYISSVPFLQPSLQPFPELH